MFLTGIADEAARDIDGQIRAHKALDWDTLEARAVDGANIHDLSEADFDRVYGRLQESGMGVCCFSSSIANWGEQITDPFELTLIKVHRAIPRMKKLGTSMIRIMSYAVLKDRGPDDQMEEERFRRLREIHRIFTGEGLTPVHENCMNYGGMGWPYTLRLMENVPGLKLVFDTGNPVFGADCTSPKPYARQSAWEFYQHVKEHVIHVHIKDARWDEGDQEAKYCFPGQGEGNVERIITDLFTWGYDGGFSIEPHMAKIFHEPGVEPDPEVLFNGYLDYGQRLKALVEKQRHK